jgi:hypothetical protein
LVVNADYRDETEKRFAFVGGNLSRRDLNQTILGAGETSAMRVALIFAHKGREIMREHAKTRIAAARPAKRNAPITRQSAAKLSGGARDRKFGRGRGNA